MNSDEMAEQEKFRGELEDMHTIKEQVGQSW